MSVLIVKGRMNRRLNFSIIWPMEQRRVCGSLTSDVCSTDGDNNRQACTADDTGSQAHRKQEAQADLSLLASLKPQDSGYGKEKDPHLQYLELANQAQRTKS